MHNSLTDIITAEDLSEVDCILAPPARRGGIPNTVPLSAVVQETFSLDASHIEELQAQHEGSTNLGLPEPALRPIHALMRPHHRLAQLLAMGMRPDRAAVLCDYTPGHVTNLQRDPSFAALMEFYTHDVDEEAKDAISAFVEKAAELSIDMMTHLRAILETTPEKITPQVALKALEVLPDRSGNGPQTKNLSVNVHVGMGDRIREGRERAAQAYLTSPAQGSG